jgi:hypothetical protein
MEMAPGKATTCISAAPISFPASPVRPDQHGRQCREPGPGSGPGHCCAKHPLAVVVLVPANVMIRPRRTTARTRRLALGLHRHLIVASPPTSSGVLALVRERIRRKARLERYGRTWQVQWLASHVYSSSPVSNNLTCLSGAVAPTVPGLLPVQETVPRTPALATLSVPAVHPTKPGV